MSGDPLVFPASILATVIACAIVFLGVKLGRKEIETGEVPRGTWIMCAILFPAYGVLFFLAMEHPFLSYVMQVLLGLLLGYGVFRVALHAYWVFRYLLWKWTGAWPNWRE